MGATKIDCDAKADDTQTLTCRTKRRRKTDTIPCPSHPRVPYAPPPLGFPLSPPPRYPSRSSAPSPTTRASGPRRVSILTGQCASPSRQGTGAPPPPVSQSALAAFPHIPALYSPPPTALQFSLVHTYCTSVLVPHTHTLRSAEQAPRTHGIRCPHLFLTPPRRPSPRLTAPLPLLPPPIPLP